MAQVALAWLIGLPRVVVIPGASSVEQLEHNAAAAGISGLLDGTGIPAFELMLATSGIAPYGVLSLPVGWHL